MRFHHILWVICSTLALVNGAPKPPGENAAHGNKDIEDMEESHADSQTTLPPSDLSVDLPENWDQAKDDTQSLFLNKSDKNDLEPYPMALSDDSADAYDGQPIPATDEKVESAPKPGALEHVLMRAEYYGEPPSMGRQPARRKRANQSSFRNTLSANTRVNKRGTRYSALSRMKRDTGMRSEDVLALLSLWDAKQRHNKDTNSYYNPSSYYELNPYEDAIDDTIDDKWLSEPVIPSSQYSNYYEPVYGDKPSHYRYPQSYPEYIADAESNYLQHLEALRRKRQWSGFDNKNRYSKRFMVAKKRSDPNQYYFPVKTYKPREDLYTLSELLRSSQNVKDQGIPLVRRMIL